MKKISIVVPCFNEQENIVQISEEIIEGINKMQDYDYELIIIDNCSTDNTRVLIEELCQKNYKIKAIFNSRNFGQFNSPYYALMQTTGDCTILICADFQDPIDMIPRFVKEWEDGYKVVVGIKSKSREGKFMYFLRTCYYKAISRMSENKQIEHFTGFGLYDKEVINVLKRIEEPTPFFRGIIAEIGFKIKEIEYVQLKRRAGKTKNNFYTLYDAAMLSFTSYTKAGLRLATFAGIAVSILSFIIGIIYLALKIVYWDRFSAGLAPVLIGTFFLGSIQLFFIGFLGEYIMAINERVKHRPLVIEEKRINFKNEE